MSLRPLWLRWWQPEQPSGQAPGFTRGQLLAVCLLMIGVNALTFYFLPQPYYDHRANLWTAAALLVLLPFAQSRRLYFVVVNAALVTAMSLVVYIGAMTGGINSSSLVFLTVMAVPALFFLGPLGAGLWLLVLLGVYVCLLLATLAGDLPRAVSDQSVILWALFNHVMAAASLVLVLRLYERMNRTQLAVVQQRNHALEETQAHLIQAQAHKDEFVAAVGHELRTPMNAILGLNSVLREELADDPVNAETAEHIRRSTEHLLKVVNDILDFAQLQAGRVSFFPEACALTPWLDATLQPYQARAQAKGLAWQLQLAPALPAQIWIDRQRLAQILGYLLDNAIKFTASGELTVSVQALDERLRVTVQDTGRGIAPERQQQIFNRFESADVATNQAYGGTGLGLSICERLVVLQGGQIGVQSAVGQGALFWFELPLLRAPQATETLRHPPILLASETALEVLVVDDNAMNLMVAQLQLRKAWPKIRVTTASSGAQALALIQSRHFDVALIDMVMPDMDGLEVTRCLRQLPLPLRNLPVVALTANTNPVDRQRCLDVGMNGVLYKPMDPALMVSVMSEVVSLQEVPA